MARLVSAAVALLLVLSGSTATAQTSQKSDEAFQICIWLDEVDWQHHEPDLGSSVELDRLFFVRASKRFETPPDGAEAGRTTDVLRVASGVLHRDENGAYWLQIGVLDWASPESNTGLEPDRIPIEIGKPWSVAILGGIARPYTILVQSVPPGDPGLTTHYSRTCPSSTSPKNPDR
jgi:hypothetical protein